MLFKIKIFARYLLPVLLGVLMLSRPVPAAPAWSGAKTHSQRILVRFKTAPSGPAHARLINLASATVSRDFRAIPQLKLLATPSGKPLDATLKIFRKSPLVLYAEPDYLVRAVATPNDPLFGQLWGLSNTGQDGGQAGADIGALSAWDISTGSPDAVIMVIDTGVDYTHPDLVGNIWSNPGEIPGNGLDDDGNGYVDDLHGINAVGLGGEAPPPSGYIYNDPMDDNGHGTHVAGTIGATGDNGLGVTGVNWEVRIAACKFLDSAGEGYISDAITCLQYAQGLKSRGIPVVATSNSWSGPGYSRALQEAIRDQIGPDILFIAAAGNSGANSDESPEYPASYDLPNLISVSATDSLDLLADFSNFGPRSTHVGAPGVNILSTCTSTLPECTGASLSSPYDSFSGTSMATPHVTGVASLLAAQNPGRAGKTIRNLILAGGDPIASLAGKTLTGERIDAAGSMLCSGKSIFGIRAPALNPLYAVINSPIRLEALDINCGDPAGPVQVRIGAATVPLYDDGVSPDLLGSDGYFSGTWTPTSEGDFYLDFQNGSESITTTVRVGPLITYRFDDPPFPYPYSWLTIGGTSLKLSDESLAQVTTPFPLRFYGLNYSTIYVSDNGAVSFSRGPIYYDNGSIPDFYQAGLVAPFWDDLYPISPTGTNNAFYDTVGTAPKRRFVIEWRNWGHYPYSTSGVTFQVVFPEESDWILFQYKDTIFGSSTYNSGKSASSGLQINPDWGTEYSYNQSVLISGVTAIRWTPAPLASTPRLKAEDDSLSFADTLVGQETLGELFLHNIGNADLSVTALSLSPSQFSLISPPSLPLSLPPGSEQMLEFSFHPDVSQTFTGELIIQSDGGDISVSLQGQGMLSPDLTVSPAPAVGFGTVQTGHTANVTLQVGNQGNKNLTITDISIAGGTSAFSWTGHSLPLSLAPGGSQSFILSFHPSSVSAYSGSLAISSNDPRKPSVRLTLTGTGIVQPEIQVSPVLLDFQTVTIGGTKSLAFAILNTGGNPLTVSFLNLAGSGFSLPFPPSVPFMINPGNRQNIQVDFSPSVTAGYSGQVEIQSDAPASPTATVSLFGNGAAPVPPLPPGPAPTFVVSPSSLDFGSVTLDTGAELALVMENQGTQDLEISSCAISGPGFSLVDAPSFPLTIAPSSSQQIRVRFFPASIGGFSGSVTVNSSDPLFSFLVVPLSGIGTVPPPPPRAQLDVFPAEINFGGATEGKARVSGLSLGNLGNADLVIDGISVTGDGFSFPEPPTLPLVLAPGETRDLPVRFLPPAAGDYSGIISLSSNDPVFPLAEIPLRGSGLDAPATPPHLSVSATEMDFGKVIIGEFQEMALAITNTAESDLVISSLNASGDFSVQLPPALPLTLSAGETRELSIRFAPGWTGIRPGNLEIASNDPDQPLMVINLSGAGLSGGEKTEGCSCATTGNNPGTGTGLIRLIFLLALAALRLPRKNR